MNLSSFSVERIFSLKKEAEKEKSYDIFDHQIVPKHELLSKKEAEQLMQEFHIQPHQLPYIKAADPASHALSAKPGDILRVTRRSATAGEVVVYRYVVEG
jgi:DNA-directed RNA polymerase subunit H